MISMIKDLDFITDLSEERLIEVKGGDKDDWYDDDDDDEDDDDNGKFRSKKFPNVIRHKFHVRKKFSTYISQQATGHNSVKIKNFGWVN